MLPEGCDDPPVGAMTDGSTFDLTSGKVLRGPATDPVPAFETRAIDGVVEIRAR